MPSTRGNEMTQDNLIEVRDLCVEFVAEGNARI